MCVKDVAKSLVAYCLGSQCSLRYTSVSAIAKNATAGHRRRILYLRMFAQN